MTARAYFGWDHGRLGTLTVTWNDGSARTASITAGAHAHIDFFGSLYTDLATALQTAVNAVSPGNTITFSTTTLLYTWSRAGAFTITAGTNTLARRILGFSSLPTGSATSHSSDVRPWYVVSGAVGGVSEVGPIHERSARAAVRYSGRKAYFVAKSDAPKFQPYSFRLEAKAAVFKDYAAASVPFTWEHGIEHASSGDAITIKTDTEERCYYLTEQGTQWDPRRVKQDWDGRFDVPFDAQWIGKV